MKFLKPKFWDNNQISIYLIFLLPFSIIVKIFNFIKSHTAKSYKSSIPIICVGNIYLGGTGKTPLCSELFFILKDLNKKPVFIKKYYKSFQDEVKMLKEIGATYESTKRINAVKKAIQNNFQVYG